nr:MAG TPA: hypothetical protein [Caudoviricetes sp.]
MIKSAALSRLTIRFIIWILCHRKCTLFAMIR